MKCGGLDKNVTHIHIFECSHQGVVPYEKGEDWCGFVEIGVALLEELYHWGQALRVYSTALLGVHALVYVYGLSPWNNKP